MKAVRLLQIRPSQGWGLAWHSTVPSHVPAQDGELGHTAYDEVCRRKDAHEQEAQQRVPAAEGSEVTEVKVPTKKYALLMAYSGRDYHGMQINPGRPTIESVLISALVNSRCVPEECATTGRAGLRLQRCSRTDKGVSALGQLVSVRLKTSSDGLVEKINSHLPADIRILGAKQVTQGFNAKSMCEGRSYSYTLPTFALSRGTEPEPSFRLSREDFHHFNHLLTFYQGTHRYHNFTSRKTADDPSVSRHVWQATLGEPYVDQDHEFATVEITGQSFLLNQIRKMVGLTLAVTQGVMPEGILPSSVRVESKVNIPLAPGLGLVLEQAHFKWYNRHFGSDGQHSPLSWEDAQPATQIFREDHIMPTILQGELEELSMTQWLMALIQQRLDGF